MNTPAWLSDLTTPAIIMIVVVALMLLTLLVVALTLWARTPADRFRHLPKWAWLPIILVSQPLGPTVFLAIGRGAASVDAAPTVRQPQTEVVDLLYGKDTPS